MVQLSDGDIHTREVLDWRGLHILHGRMSSCSQKLRIFLNLKGIDWQGHEMNLAASETYLDWFLGINPRGLVPVLVWNGAVHIESNDILALLDEAFPEPRLIPKDQAAVAELLRREDDLHLDLRALSFRFVIGRTNSNKTPEMLARYRDGERTVNGAPDHEKRAHEINFYERLAAQGISDEAVRAAAAKFRATFNDLEQRLARGPYFLGRAMSVMDIAWFVYASRLNFGGYPFAKLHPRVHAWRETLAADERFAREVAPPQPVLESIARNHAEWARTGATFSDVTGF
ncbi:MAG: glutathione S-transferase family protein [Alphaproteobacteria bacterium]|nr:glutathione S-transferase family protein [Alphaproteobacteria bacterium]